MKYVATKRPTELSETNGYAFPLDSLDFPREGKGGPISIKSRNLSRFSGVLYSALLEEVLQRNALLIFEFLAQN
jgi:hypothetical protein